MMRVEVFALCEHASDENGRLTILRSFDVVNGSVLPATIPDVVLAVRLKFWPSETGTHQIAVHFIDPDGVPLIEPVASAIVIQPQYEDRPCGYNLFIKFRELTCVTTGEHGFDFYLDGVLEARLPLYVDLHQ